jgi:hypothetical protein
MGCTRHCWREDQPVQPPDAFSRRSNHVQARPQSIHPVSANRVRRELMGTWHCQARLGRGRGTGRPQVSDDPIYQKSRPAVVVTEGSSGHQWRLLAKVATVSRLDLGEHLSSFLEELHLCEVGAEGVRRGGDRRNGGVSRVLGGVPRVFSGLPERLQVLAMLLVKFMRRFGNRPAPRRFERPPPVRAALRSRRVSAPRPAGLLRRRRGPSPGPADSRSSCPLEPTTMTGRRDVAMTYGLQCHSIGCTYPKH